MSRRSGRTAIAALFAIALCAVLTVGATSASANRLRPHYTAKQKAAIHKNLARQLKHNPKVIRSSKWLRLAAITDYQLPLTIRLNPKIGAGSFLTSNDTAAIDLGSTFGTVTPKLYGSLRAKGRFADPFQGGTLGEIDITLSSADNAAGSTLRTDPINLLSNVDVTTTPIAGGGCSDFDFTGDPPDNPATWSSDVPVNTVFRTTQLSLGVASGGGVANLLSDGASDQGARLSLSLAARIWSVFRTLDPPSPLHCKQAVTGYVDNALPSKVIGTLKISPGVTFDGYLRLARIAVHGIPTNISVAACLSPDSIYGATPGLGTAAAAFPAYPCNTHHDVNLAGAGVQFLPGDAATVQLDGNLNVTALSGEVIVGYTNNADEQSGNGSH